MGRERLANDIVDHAAILNKVPRKLPQAFLKSRNFAVYVAARSVLCDEEVFLPGSIRDCFGKERLAMTRL
jgi:hypothetical protein